MTSFQILKELVSFDSVSGTDGVARCADWIFDFAGEHGCRCERVGGGLIISNGGDGDRGLVLSGHIDVVPVAGQNWAKNPFVVTQYFDEKLYGRGTSDMKGGVACMLHAIAKARVNWPLYLVLTCDEETADENIGDVAAFLRRTGKKLSCIVGEPTELAICDRHKGGQTYDVHFIGRAGHCADPKNGVSAIYMFADFARRFRDLAASFDGATTTIGIVKGGTASNIIPERCDALIGFRYFDAKDGAAMMDEIQKIILEVEKEYGGRVEIEKTSELLPLLRRDDSPITDLALRAGGGAVDTFPAMTEASILQDAGLDAIVCGPGFFSMAHKPDEYTTQEQLDGYDEILNKIIEMFA
ncbi:MAG: M20 family metallopeptidase [Rickettsiales bacterium]|jgi:acetylornithine deacetylase|nr:M20 family metallopeptidase [Rickettsiales bacterium]